MTISVREEPYDRNLPKDREWLKECAVKALSDRKMRIEGRNTLSQLLLHEIICEEYPKDEAYPAYILNPPIDALENINISLYE